MRDEKTNNYWQKRQEENYLSGEKTAGELLETMQTVYKNSLKEINKEIEAFYGRYANNNRLTIEEVNKRLNPEQLKSAKEELKKYYDMAKPELIGREMSKAYRQELRLQSARTYMSRLEALKADMKNIVVKLGAKEQKGFDRTLSEIYSDSYKKINFGFDKFQGFSAGFSRLDEKALNSAIHQKWQGRNFSDSIWANKGKLLDSLNTTFLQGVAQGKNPEKIARDMSKELGTDFNRCSRLARTESAHIMGEATLQGYKERGTEEYEIIATLDGRTSDICQSFDGKHFPVKDAQEGVNYPPFHVNCRSTTAPYYPPDEIDAMFDKAERIARDGNGKLYYVPADMTYKEWNDTFVDKTKEPKIQIPNLIDDEKSTLRGTLEEENIEKVKIEMWKSSPSEQQIINFISGGDKTKGSCASLAMTYAMNKSGYKMLDFRGGKSQAYFSMKGNLIAISKLKAVKTLEEKDTNDFKAVERLLKLMKGNTEYILVTGSHASVIKKNGNKYQYLELQSRENNGWKNFERDTLKKRFKCQRVHTSYRMKIEVSNILIEVDTLNKNKEFHKLMEYINTNSDSQQKGLTGGIK